MPFTGETPGLPLPLDRDDLDVEHVRVGAHGAECGGGGLFGDRDLGDGGVARAEDDVLHLLHVHAVVLERAEEGGEDADAVGMADDEQMGALVAARHIDDVRRVAGGLVLADDAHDFLGDGVLGFLGARADVVGRVDRGILEAAIVVAGGGAGLAFEDVEAGADAAAVARFFEGGLLDDLAATRIDKDRAIGQAIEKLLAEHALGVRREGDVNGNDVGLRSDFIERLGAANAQRGGNVGGHPAAVGDDIHAKRAGDGHHVLPDLAHTDKAEGFSIKPACGAELLLVPLALAKLRDIIGNTAIARENKAKCKLGNRVAILARAIRDINALIAGGGDIDGVVSGPSANDEAEVGVLEHVGGDLGRTNDQDIRLGVLDRVL